jgi:hypothetical protein
MCDALVIVTMSSDNLPPLVFPHADDLHLACSAGNRSVIGAVSWAWERRWVPLPVSWPALRDWGRSRGLDDDGLRFLAWVGGRRAHFAFAHTTMRRFCAEALVDHPGDELLSVLLHAADTMSGDRVHAWSSLAAAAHADHAEGVARHVYLTSANYATDVPVEFLRDALDMARAMAGPDDVVAAYRVVSLLRRLGAYRDAVAAGDAVNELLISGVANPVLADHLSERVLTERHLCIELLHARGDRSV